MGRRLIANFGHLRFVPSRQIRSKFLKTTERVKRDQDAGDGIELTGGNSIFAKILARYILARVFALPRDSARTYTHVSIIL